MRPTLPSKTISFATDANRTTNSEPDSVSETVPIGGGVPGPSQIQNAPVLPTPRQSVTQRANCNISVARVERFLRQGNYADRVSKNAAIHLTSMVEYLVAEIFDLSANKATLMKKRRIQPRHIYLAIKQDEELDRLLSNVTIARCGTIPHINQALLPKQPVLPAASANKRKRPTSAVSNKSEKMAAPATKKSKKQQGGNKKK